ncbi:hypothetical protein [Arthrobacter sp. H35-D1]|uniref:hypothetical protein n=1 Tax=Arthrobacter sp. H35-D1 TaxID=3046202 RepID=UPI0024BA8A4A|nr:hypothetical protein [Arthrobacter sp. H35-D1]MDJ0312311.1 hypothetical protein [Arthrobacter sp. H35-D1]
MKKALRLMRSNSYSASAPDCKADFERQVQAATTLIKNIQRIARGFRNPINYQ